MGCDAMSLVRKNVLITGASRGLGHHLARHFWDKGANLLLVARNTDLLHQTLDGLSVRHGQMVRYFTCDLSDDASLQALVDELDKYRVDAIVNNAAIQGPIGPLQNNEWEEWKQTIQVNLLAPVFICKALLPKLLAQETGASVINLSGGGATGPRANFTAYASAKTGLVRFSETVAEELKNTPVRINCVAPGPMPTDMLRGVLNVGSDAAGGKEVNAAEKVLSASVSSFHMVSELCEYLASDKSIGVSGKLISAIWDPWERFEDFGPAFQSSDVGTLRRIVPEDRGASWESFDTPPVVDKSVR